MPLTAFQRGVAHILATNRNPESHIAGGAAINRADPSLRFSEDLDIFHDAAASVACSAEADENVLREAGYAVMTIGNNASAVSALCFYPP